MENRNERQRSPCGEDVEHALRAQHEELRRQSQDVSRQNESPYGWILLMVYAVAGFAFLWCLETALSEGF